MNCNVHLSSFDTDCNVHLSSFERDCYISIFLRLVQTVMSIVLRLIQTVMSIFLGGTIFPKTEQAAKTQSKQDKSFSFIFHRFWPFICCLSVVLWLDKGDSPENLHKFAFLHIWQQIFYALSTRTVRSGRFTTICSTAQINVTIMRPIDK